MAEKSRPAATASRPLTGLRILDIGCGGGLLAEPVARLATTGIDATEAAIMAATTHAKQADLDIDYRCSTAEDIASTGATFDVIMRQK